jgi:hypothetical protein
MFEQLGTLKRDRTARPPPLSSLLVALEPERPAR